MDKADGSGTLLFDLAARDWSAEVLVGARRSRADWLPPTFEGPQVTGAVTDRAAAATGLRAGTPVVAGGGDQAANAVGVGVVSPGTMALSLGTSGVVFAATDRPLFEPRGRVHAFCHAVPGRWHLMSVMLSAAGSLRWFRDTLAPDVVVRGPRGLGRRRAGRQPTACSSCPTCPASAARTPTRWRAGAFVGLTLGHDRRHMTRAVLEGVAFGLRDGLDLMIEAGMPAPAQIRASGGGMASPLWRQILADVLDAEIATVETTEGAAYGAGLLAAVGAGWYPTVEAAVDAVVRVTPVAEPGPDAAAYAERHAVYRELYPALAPTFQRLVAGSRPQAAEARPATSGDQPRSSICSSSFSVTSPGFLPRMIIPRTASASTSLLFTVSTIRPWYMTLIRSDRSNTSWMSWLIRKIPMPSSSAGGPGCGPGRSRPVRGPRSARP